MPINSAIERVLLVSLSVIASANSFEVKAVLLVKSNSVTVMVLEGISGSRSGVGGGDGGDGSNSSGGGGGTGGV